MPKQCFIMVGVSGSGKTTWLANNHPDALICSADDYHMKHEVYRFDGANLNLAYQASIRKFVDGCVRGVEKIASDNTNASIDQLAPYYMIASSYGYEVNIIRLVVKPDECFKRNSHGTPSETCVRQNRSIFFMMEALPVYWKYTFTKFAGY